MWAHAAHTGSSFLVKRKEPKIHKEPVGSLTSNGRGNSPFDPPSGESSFARFSGAMTAKVISAKTKTLPCPLSTPPMMLEASVVNEGERHGVTVGETSPLRRYQRGHFLFDTLLVPFLVKEKEPQGWAA